MGWGRTLFLGDIGNRLDIADVETDVVRLKRELRTTRRRDMSQDETIAELSEENAQLKLYLASLIRLLAAKRTITVEELSAMVSTIDAEDGQADGRYDGDVV